MQNPQRIGKYTVIERIGRGGMGFVYRGVDPILKRDVALKTMLKDISEDPELRGRFMREAQSAGGLRHPNIVTIYDLGEDEQGCPYIAMEFLTGTDLEHIIKNRIDLQVTKKLDIIIQTALGLAYAHNNGIVHRDIKPANIRLLDHGEVKIMDFGIAKITASHFTRTGMIMGTPHYMSPEQIRGEKVDGRADIFSLGVVLFELLTNRKPFPGDNPITVLFKIIHSGPDPLTDVSFTPPEGLEEIVLRAMAKKQEERYQTCDEFAADLMNVYDRIQPPAQTLVSGAGTPVPFSMPSGSQTPRWVAKTVRQGPVGARTPTPSHEGAPIPPTEVKPQQPDSSAPIAAEPLISIPLPHPTPVKTGPTQKALQSLSQEMTYTP